MSVVRKLAARLARLEEANTPPLPPPRIVDLVVDADGIVRRAVDDDGRELAELELIALGLPRRVAPGAFRDASGEPREATSAERAEYEARTEGAGRYRGIAESRP